MKRKLLDKITDLLFPPKCAACGEVTASREALCEDCLKKYTAETKMTCPSCGKTAQSCECSEIEALACLTFYSGYYNSDNRVTERLIYSLKTRKNARLASFFARDIASEIVKKLALSGGQKDEYILTHIPRGERNFEKYGFDHGEVLCERISYYTGIKHKCLFTRHGGTEQKKMNYGERICNAESTLTVSSDANVRGKRVILIDDIVTTGATVKTAVRLLESHGADEVVYAFIARTASKRRRGS